MIDLSADHVCQSVTESIKVCMPVPLRQSVSDSERLTDSDSLTMSHRVQIVEWQSVSVSESVTVSEWTFGRTAESRMLLVNI